jgi:hypothetical protein
LKLRLLLGVLAVCIATLAVPCRAQWNVTANAYAYTPSDGSNYLVFGAPGTATVSATTGHALSFSGVASTSYPVSYVCHTVVDGANIATFSFDGTRTTDSNGYWALGFSLTTSVTLFHGTHTLKGDSNLVVSYDVSAGPNSSLTNTFYVTVYGP